MAQSRAEIKQTITTRFMADETLAERYGFEVGAAFDDEFSVLSWENIVFDIIAFVMFLQQLLHDQHKVEVEQIIYEKSPHTERWYQQKAKDFMYGFELLPDSDKFDTAGASEDEIAQSKIIKYAAVPEPAADSRLMIKIATEENGELSTISTEQQAAFESYIRRVKDAGVRFLVINYPADLLTLQLRVYRNSNILTSEGMSVRDGNYPVKDAINDFMKNLPFNGEMVLMDLLVRLKQVPGVVNVHLLHAESQAIDINTEVYGPAQPIDVKTIPVSGYFKLTNLDNITYVV